MTLAAPAERGKGEASNSDCDTFVTRPDALYTVAYDRDGGGPLPPSEVATTAPHPFYVSNRDGDGDGRPGGFVATSDLRAGDELALADGSAATVTRLGVEYAGPAGAFTTYNFEVADFHTYFVNADGVWVHNAGNRFCEKVYSAFRQVRKRLRADNLPAGVDPADVAKSEILTAAKWTAERTPNLPKENVANLYSEAFETIKREKGTGWLDFFEGRAMPPRPNNPNPLEPGHTLLKHVNVTDQDILNRAEPSGGDWEAGIAVHGPKCCGVGHLPRSGA